MAENAYLTIVVLMTLVLLSPAIARGDAAIARGDAATGGQDVVSGSEEMVEEAHFSSGLDFNSLWSRTTDLVGPGFTWGLILIPSKLEMELSVHSLVGGNVNSIPIGLIFKVPFSLGKYLFPYIGAGPLLIFDREKLRTEHDFAAGAVVGVGFSVPGSRWRIFVEGDYNIRFWQATVHQGGLSAGFQYRF